MSDVIFVGPSLAGGEALRRIDAVTVRGPAGAGDILEAVEAGAHRIGLIDGYFDQRLAVWHKEILWALSRGVHVYGAASMGALRAAELSPFGMRGVGVIFDWYRSGLIEADDEVAVVHQDEETDYRSVSEALVNIRATLVAARREGLIDREQEELLVSLGRATFYPDRHLRSLVRRARAMADSGDAYERLEKWLGAGRELPMDQKREDALELLDVMRQNRQLDSEPFMARFDFEYTEVWHEFVRRTRARAGGPAQRVALEQHRMPQPSDESSVSFVVDGGSFAVDEAMPSERVSPQAWRAGLERVLATHLAPALNVRIEAAETQQAADAFRRQHGLLTTEQTREWLDARGLSMSTFSRLMHDNVLVSRCSAALNRIVTAEVEDLERLKR